MPGESSPAGFRRLERFDDVDASGEANTFVAFLEWADARPDVVARRRRSYELLCLRRGDRAVDVGCGTGTVVADLQELGINAIGIDASEEMLAQARRRVPGGDFRRGDVASLPLEDASLAGYRAERLYQHLADPAAALLEARRVLQPSGRIVILDQDWDSFIVDAADKATTRAILLAFSDSIVNGWAGRQHRRRLLDAGFHDVTVEAETVAITDYDYLAPVLGGLRDSAVVAGVAASAVDAWLDDQRHRGETGRFLAAMTHFLVRATA